MYNHELTLIKQGYDIDGLGNHIPIEEETTVLCKVASVGRNEFYSASSAGLKPEVVFIIHRYEYDAEEVLVFENERYSVVRTYANGFEEIELVCERKIADEKS